jgi:hypothetical protein
MHAYRAKRDFRLPVDQPSEFATGRHQLSVGIRSREQRLDATGDGERADAGENAEYH